MATWYTDVALNQQLGNNFPGQVGVSQIGLTDGQVVQNNPQFEGPPIVFATYTWTGNEAANDIINIAVARQGMLVDPSNSFVSSGLTAVATTLTMAIGDNDLGLVTNLPVVNAAAATAAVGTTSTIQAPVWVSGTTYVAGNVVLDANSVPANQAFMALSTTSGTTAPHSAANTLWMPAQQRYSNSIDVHAAAGNVAFSGGTQNYGGPASTLPNSAIPGQAQTGFSAASLANQQYTIQGDCWLQAILLTVNTPVANTVSIFRIQTVSLN